MYNILSLFVASIVRPIHSFLGRENEKGAKYVGAVRIDKRKENNLQYIVNPLTFSIAGPNERLVVLTHTAYLFWFKVCLSLSL